jgi:hypothetical protein
MLSPSEVSVVGVSLNDESEERVDVARIEFVLRHACASNSGSGIVVVGHERRMATICSDVSRFFFIVKPPQYRGDSIIATGSFYRGWTRSPQKAEVDTQNNLYAHLVLDVCFGWL